MASSNRHWPSMFRSNPAAGCDFHHQQPDMNNHHSKPSLISSGIDQETGRSPGETKPRWNPRPEQIRILEGIFNSGVVNPPRDEIRRIRLRLQEYGHVADANVFYWFQNRKSRTKNKLRAAQAAAQGQQPIGRAALTCAPAPHAAPAPPVTPPRHFLAPAGTLQAPTSSSSSSSDRSSGSSRSVTMKPAASQEMLPPSAATTIGMFAPAPLSACQLYCLQSHPMPMPTPTPTPSVRDLITSTPETPPTPLLLQWQTQSPYLPATELGGVLGSHAHAHSPVFPGMHLPSLCNEAALGQHEIVNMSGCSNSKLGLGGGQFFLNTTTGTTDHQPSHRTDAVSAVFTEDEKARLGSLHYGLGAVSTTPAAAAAPVHADFDVGTAAVLPCTAPTNNAAAASSAFTDQLQGMLDSGLLTGGGAPVPATVVAVAAARPDAGVQWYSVPAMTRLDVGLFGDAAVLLRHTGEPVPLDGFGVTVEPLQHGAVYYVLV